MRQTLSILIALSLLLCLSSCYTRQNTDVKDSEEEHVVLSEEPIAAEIVTYYCSIGNYTDALLAQIQNWNETEGAEKGVEIQVTTLCNCPLTLEDHLARGDRWDLFDGGNDFDLCSKGWITDLSSLSNQQIQSLLDSYRKIMLSGACIFDDITVAVPKEAIPIKLTVNLDLFEKNGLELPKTWEEIITAARIITENGDGTEYGWGASTWNRYFSTFILKGSMGSTEVGYWDPNTAVYQFSQYETPINALAQMYQNNSILGLDNMGLDEIRYQFSKGKVGMLPAISIDYTVYTQQFPAQCNYTFIDMPAYDSSTHHYSNVFYYRCGPSICAPAYNQSSEVHQRAIEEAWLFLNSDQLNQSLYQNGCIIPCKQELMEQTKLLPEENDAQWTAISNLENYTIETAENSV